MEKLARGLEPTDFEGADCRVSDWWVWESDPRVVQVRLWQCKVGPYWFLRHEWLYRGRNETDLDPWLFAGYFHGKQFPKDMKRADALT